MKRKIAAVTTGLLAAVLVACGGPGADGEGAAIVVGTTDGLTLTPDAPAPLDPAYAYDLGTWNILRQGVQTLMIQPNGEGDPVPEAAESCGFLGGDNEAFACTLREDLKFSDGNPITANDVKYSIERALAVRADSGVFALLSTVRSVETKGDREVVFHLTDPDATFPFKLTTPVAGIVNPRFYRADELRNGLTLDGSGPYTLKAEQQDGALRSITFTRNPQYRGTLKVNNHTVVLRTFPDAEAMGAALEGGDIDVMTRTMSSKQITKYADYPDGKIRLLEIPGLEIRYLGFNTDAPPVHDKAVRQALAQVIDRASLVSEVYGTQASELYSIVPAGIVGHSNPFFNKYGKPSTARARAILQEADIPTPVPLALHYTTDHYGSATKQEFEVLRRQLNNTGLFDVTIDGSPWKTFRPAERDGKFAVYGMGWFPDFPDADSYIAPFLDKDNMLKSPYVNPQIRQVLIPRSRRESDRLAASVDSLETIQEIVADDVPILPLWQSKQYLAAADDITGLAYAVNASATLQLWELRRGASE
ncbi:ABC transporter substrate-binding protein [Streptomyces sp. NPDC013178]|uniref:ABC transporter substrate-binding protein n=1 Tax=Streptomyces sp. NPDC013178 TaxID=3155118 RepID=UPI0033D5791F